jgi:hypothetical protein
MTAAVDNQARWWTYGRQLLGQAAADPAAALRAVVGVYSSHPSAPLSLHARCAGLDARGFHAVDALRLPAMRGSIHLLPRATAHLPFRALPEPTARTAYRLKGFGLDEARHAALREKVLAAAAGEPCTPAELAAAAGEDVKGVIATMTREGSLVRVGADGLRSNALRYVATAIPEADRAEALAWLVEEYLRAFGPARREDVIWWTGEPASRVDPALETVDTVRLEGGLLLRAADERGFEKAAPPPRGRVDLLPKWDCYTMGYPAGARARFAHPDVAERCYDFRGDGMPVVLVDGEAAGTWALAGTGRKAAVEVDWFDKPGAAVLRALAERAEAVLAFLS